MPNKTFNARIQLKRDTSSNWIVNNPVLLDGEMVIVDGADDGVRLKIGDGTSNYTSLLFRDFLPSGVICMWSGSASNVPVGWTICDGNNGTPDLRNRFIVGAGDTYSVGELGGQIRLLLGRAKCPHTLTQVK